MPGLIPGIYRVAYALLRCPEAPWDLPAPLPDRRLHRSQLALESLSRLLLFLPVGTTPVGQLGDVLQQQLSSGGFSIVFWCRESWLVRARLSLRSLLRSTWLRSRNAVCSIKRLRTNEQKGLAAVGFGVKGNTAAAGAIASATQQCGRSRWCRRTRSVTRIPGHVVGPSCVRFRWSGASGRDCRNIEAVC